MHASPFRLPNSRWIFSRNCWVQCCFPWFSWAGLLLTWNSLRQTSFISRNFAPTPLPARWQLRLLRLLLTGHPRHAKHPQRWNFPGIFHWHRTKAASHSSARWAFPVGFWRCRREFLHEVFQWLTRLKLRSPMPTNDPLKFPKILNYKQDRLFS